MKNMIILGMGIGMGYMYSKYDKQIMNAVCKMKNTMIKKSSY